MYSSRNKQTLKITLLKFYENLYSNWNINSNFRSSKGLLRGLLIIWRRNLFYVNFVF